MGNKKTLDERRSEAARIVDEMNAEYNSVLRITNDSLQQLSEITSSKDEFKKLLPQIAQLSNKVNESLEAGNAKRNQLNSLLNRVDSFYNKKFLPLQTIINDPKEGLNAKIKEGNVLSKDIEKVRLRNKSELEIVIKLTADFKKKIRELQTIEGSIRAIESKVQNNELSINKKLAIIEDQTIKVNAATKHIFDSEKDIANAEASIKLLHKKWETASSEIQSRSDEADDTLEKIRNIYEVAARTGLGGEFNLRKLAYEKDMGRWRKHLFWTSIVLFIVISCLFLLQLYTVNWDMARLKFDVNFFARFLLTSPLIFYLVFVTNQFNKSRTLVEKYSFKTALALSIEAHINLLTSVEVFQETDRMNKITNFIIEGFNKIYDVPFEGKSTIKNNKNEFEELIDTLKKVIDKSVSSASAAQ